MRRSDTLDRVDTFHRGTTAVYYTRARNLQRRSTGFLIQKKSTFIVVHLEDPPYLTNAAPNVIEAGIVSPSGGTIVYAEITVAANSKPVRSAIYRPGQILKYQN